MSDSPSTTMQISASSVAISLETLKALSTLLDLSEGEALAALHDARAPEGYRRYEVPKGNGKVRVIHAPSDALKAAQRATLDRALSRVPVSPFAHGFAHGKSIITNARVHATTARAVLNIDLQDAFPSVSEARVRQVIEWRLGPVLRLEMPLLSPTARVELYEALTRLCTREGALPQGAPTSGCLLNLVCASLDRKVFGLAMRSGLPQVRYSRYADDLTITSSAPIPHDFVLALQRAIMESGFKANPAKIHAHTDAQRAIVVCGIRLHRGTLALPQESLKRYRALFTRVARTSEEDLSLTERQQVMGVIGFLRHVYPACPTPLLKPLNELIGAHGWLKVPAEDTRASYKRFTYSDLQLELKER
jgi:RNA-directed DNA polymerase